MISGFFIYFNMESKQFIFIFIGLLIMAILLGIALGIQSKSEKYSFQIHRENMELMYDGSRADFVNSIDSIIRVSAPNTSMNGLEILKQCENYNIDIFFVLSQGHIESHFGTKGMATKTNSVFNVFAYDGHEYDSINPKGKYQHPDLSIVPYLKLLKKRYLVNGKTEADLMHNYVDVNGNRYASAKDYEASLLNQYQKYSSDPLLLRNYQKYQKCKILSGK